MTTTTTPQVTTLDTWFGGGCTQWNSARGSYIYNGRAIEISLSPEGHRWWGQVAPSIKVLVRGEWLKVTPPVLDEVLGEYVGTYAPNSKEPQKQAALRKGLDHLLRYTCNWIDMVEANL